MLEKLRCDYAVGRGEYLDRSRFYCVRTTLYARFRQTDLRTSSPPSYSLNSRLTRMVRQRDRRITSFEEGKESLDFWSILDGDREEYAKAHQWLYRPTSFTPYSLPTIYTLDQSSRANLNSTTTRLEKGSLHILQTEMEWLLLVPTSRKDDRERIEGGLKAMSNLITKEGKGTKVQGVLIFPSALPRDVRFAMRGLDVRMEALNEEDPGVKVVNFWSVEEYREEFLIGI